jgi:hypothetical protein
MSSAKPDRSQAKPPSKRRLRGYAFDPSLSVDPNTRGINHVTYAVRWEELRPGPVGEYLEVMDHDPLSGRFYEPVDLGQPALLATDGLPPSGTDPQFHQQMVYAVAMTTIENFEKALGRRVLWAPHETGGAHQFVQRLRIHPHAVRAANAYYSPSMKALLFGYFRADESSGSHPPGAIVFNCLSHDVIAHETTHALLDGMHRRYLEPTHPDVLAFHEAFADVVALFQRFANAAVLRHTIARTRGFFRQENLLAELAQEFGRAVGREGALRSAVGSKPDPLALEDHLEPHGRGAILVAAIFEAFNTVYDTRAERLMRLATGGSGILAPGALPEILIDHLAEEAAKTAKQFLSICIRALDYCPPVAITFGDYLRALITADRDMVPEDELGYRVAIIHAFRSWGIFANGVTDLSEESIAWPQAAPAGAYDADWMRERLLHTPDWFRYETDRKDIFGKSLGAAAHFHDDLLFHVLDAAIHQRAARATTAKRAARRNALHAELKKKLKEQGTKGLDHTMAFAEYCGIVLDPAKANKLPGLKMDDAGLPSFQVHHFRTAFRARPDGSIMDQLILSITQSRQVELPDGLGTFTFHGGATLIIDLGTLEMCHCIRFPIDDEERLREQREHLLQRIAQGGGRPLQQAEPFAFLHQPHHH